MIDSHVHLNREEFAADRDDVMARARDAGVTGFLNVGYDLQSSRESVATAEADPCVRATVGVHPHDATELVDDDGRPRSTTNAHLDELRRLAADPSVVAIGEIGLDFYRDLSPRPAQRAALALQLALACDLELPVVFHIRDAYDDTLALVDEIGLSLRGGVLHSFAGEVEHIEWARRHGCLLGIGGPVTYRNSRLPATLATAGVTAAEVLLETDAPWLPPVPHRGRRNESAFLVGTCEVLATLLEVAPNDLAMQTDRNFERLFGAWPGVLDVCAGTDLE